MKVTVLTRKISTFHIAVVNKMAKSVKRVAFSDEKLFTLIELYRQNECLWDIKSPYYKNTIKRKAAFTIIGEKLDLDEETIKKKIASLRATYILEKKKITDSQRTGTGTDDVYFPTIPWFEHMQFLNDVIIPRKTVSTLQPEDFQTQVCINFFIVIISFINVSK